MRRIIVSAFVTLDGVAEAPEKWQLRYVSEEMNADTENEICKADALLFGRTTFQIMAEPWKSRAGKTADKFNTLPKYVVSGSLQKANWNNSKIISTNFLEEISKLQGRILIWGSIKLVQSLLKNKLVDELRLYLHPLIKGPGKRLFEEESLYNEVKLIETKRLSNGVIISQYTFDNNRK
jgi:dihydrofolate reductase